MKLFTGIWGEGYSKDSEAIVDTELSIDYFVSDMGYAPEMRIAIDNLRLGECYAIPSQMGEIHSVVRTS